MSNVMTSAWQQAAKAADLTVGLDKTTPMFFRYIEPGCFQMGSRGESAREEPLHQVRITQPFFMGTFPVTQAQWRSVVDQFPGSGLKSDPSHFKGDTRPVEQVRWDDAVAWCELIVNSQLLRELQRADGKVIAVGQFGLPTEAQWEYACRAGTETEYYTGDGKAERSRSRQLKTKQGGTTQRSRKNREAVICVSLGR